MRLRLTEIQLRILTEGILLEFKKGVFQRMVRRITVKC